MKPEIKIGIGYDSHQLMIDRPLILGGVIIPHPRGLMGHSDADVVLHAAGLGDIGMHFPDSDKKYKDIKSTKILAEVFRLIVRKGYRVGNVDIVIIAEAPKLSSHIPVMKSKIAGILLISKDEISIKATTNEKMGFVGREEGIAAMAVSLIYKDNGTITQPD